MRCEDVGVADRPVKLTRFDAFLIKLKTTSEAGPRGLLTDSDLPPSVCYIILQKEAPRSLWRSTTVSLIHARLD